MRRINFGLLVPTTLENAPTVEELNRLVISSDKLRFHSLWTLERLLHPNPCFHGLSVLTHAASITKRIRIGTSVLLVLLRNPILIAKTLSTMDYLSQGRLTVGVSLGGKDSEYETLNLTSERRVAKFFEWLKIIRKLWTERQVNYSGEFFKLTNVEMYPKPIQSHVPILLGGNSISSIERAGVLGDGYLASASGSPEDFSENWGRVVKIATHHGRDPTKLDAVKLLYTYVNSNGEEAYRMLKRWADSYYQRDFDVKKNCAYGTPNQCMSVIESYIKSGVKTFILGPPTTDVSQLEMLRDKVLANLT